MSDYTHKRLPDVDDMAPQFGMPAEMQARFAARPLDLERTGLTYFRLAPGFRIPFAHRHEDQEEVYVVVRGSARIKVGDDVLELSELDAVRVAGDTLRNLEAGPDGAEVIAFGEHAGEDQSEMVPGWWGEDSSS
jgi:mannose-6-phosphate isomerase-like protein (cupin superfamily)